MPWTVRKLRGSKVFVRVGRDGAPAADADGRVDIVYKLADGAKVYRAAMRNLAPTGDAADEAILDVEPATTTAATKPRGAGRAPSPPRAPADAIIVYTDGACTGNPGPAGLGAVIIDGDDRQELSEYLGEATNNVAELTAILRALEHIKDPSRPVWLHSDSTYCIGLLSKGWKAKANAPLVTRLRERAAAFTNLRFIKVPAHCGVPENERADALARAAVERR